MLSKQSLNPNSAAIYQSNILVVDDTILNREVIATYLENEGYGNIAIAEDGADALQKMENFLPDLIITDILMPVMDGFEFIRQIRRQKNFRHIPVIVQTAIISNEDKQEAWSSGANDVLSKPIHKLELLSRVKVQLVAMHMMRELEAYYTLSQKDIQQALALQRSLLPSEEMLASIKQRYDVSVDYIFEPSRFLSGDLWGIIEIDDNQLGIWMCDYAGKGIQASLNTFRIHTLVQEYKASAANPSDMLRMLNKRFHSMIQVGQFATFLFGIVDKKAKVFNYVSASPPDPIIYFPKEARFSLGDGSGLPLGVSKDASYPLRTIPLEEGSCIILYSDAFWENAIRGICFLPEYLPAFVHELKGRSMVSTVRNHLGMIGDIQLSDDLTLIEIQV